jgi:hypothetical protein
MEQFYVGKDRIDIPANVEGEWVPTYLMGGEVKSKKIFPWKFMKEKITTFDKKNRRATIETVYFKVGDHIFCDAFPGEPEEKTSEIWLCHIVPSHTLCKVIVSNEKLQLIPLNVEWVTKASKEKRISVRFQASDDYFLLFSSPEQWRAILLKHGGSSKAFDAGLKFEFRRKRN